MNLSGRKVGPLNLTLVGPGATPEQTAAAAAANMELLGQNAAKQGFNILSTISSTKQQSFTLSSFVAVTDFQSSVNTSGGTVVYIAVLSLYVSSCTLTAQLLADGQVVSTKIFGDSGVGLGTMTLMWIGQPSAGQHTFKINVLVNNTNGSALNNSSYPTSEGYIVEIIL